MAQRINLPLSWYEATAQRGGVSPFAARICDVCVIGGGLAGLTAALELARAGKSVTLLEAGRLGTGASGRNGGFVGNGFSAGHADIASAVGEDEAKALHKLSCMGTEFVRREVLSRDIMGKGKISVIRHGVSGGLKAYAERMARGLGEDVTYLSPPALHALLDTARYFDGVMFHGAFHIHPLRYLLSLADKAKAQGAVLHEDCPALSIEKQGAGFRVVTPQGVLSAQHVVHCTSALGGKLHPLTGRAILPVATYVAVTEPLQQSVIRTRSAISDTRRAGDYYRLVDDGRLLWGGRITTRVSAPERLAEKMRGDMISVYPQLGNLRIDYAWPGIMGYSLHKMPLIGRDAEGQWFATAFGGHGLNTTAMASLLIARAIAADDDEYRRFSAFGPTYAFGPFGRIGVQASYWLMQARDRRDESRKIAP